MSKLADELLAIAKGSSGASLKARTHAETVATLRRAAAVLEQKDAALRVAAAMLDIEARTHREAFRAKAAEAVERCIENTRSALEDK